MPAAELCGLGRVGSLGRPWETSCFLDESSFVFFVWFASEQDEFGNMALFLSSSLLRRGLKVFGIAWPASAIGATEGLGVCSCRILQGWSNGADLGSLTNTWRICTG